MSVEQVEQIRHFNRLVSQRIGALDQDYLARGRPLGEARIIFEIGSNGVLDLRRMRDRLGLDSGYLSRLLRSLEKQDLVSVAKSEDDGRVRLASLTARGASEFAAYDGLSNDLALSMLMPLKPALRARLVTAMNVVARLLKAGSVEIALEPPQGKDARWCLARYYSELARRFEGGFDQSQGNTFDTVAAKPPLAYFLVARIEGEPVGCGALRRLGGGIGEIKRVWASPRARGLGIGTAIMDRLEAIAREAGLKALRLDTNRTLTEAQALYRARGYRDIARYNTNPYAHFWLEKQLPPEEPLSAKIL